MINEIDSLKCSITVDMDIPFDFKEEISDVFDTIVDNLYSSIKKNYKHNFKICANYTSCNNIDIYKFKNTDNDSFVKLVKDSLDNLTKVEYIGNDMEDREIVNVDYVIEFNYSHNYYVSSDSIKL